MKGVFAMNEVKRCKAKKDTQSRKWFLTINNPDDNGITVDTVEEQLKTIHPVKGWFISGEEGKNGTYHIHVYVYCQSAIRFSTLKRHFNEANIEMAKGSNQQIREYIFKEGSENHRSFGDIPIERPGARTSSEELCEMVRQGVPTYEIIQQKPSAIHHLKAIDQYRQLFNYEQHGKTYRDVEVMYVEGKTNVGKTQWVFDYYGFENVYMIDTYNFHPYDNYTGQDVLVLDEFESQIDSSFMRRLLDKFPLTLKSRYTNKQACFTKVIIISNLPLKEQYRDIQRNEPETWEAIIRRIHTVRVYSGFLKYKDYTIDEYFSGFSNPQIVKKPCPTKPRPNVKFAPPKKPIPTKKEVAPEESPQPEMAQPVKKKKQLQFKRVAPKESLQPKMTQPVKQKKPLPKKKVESKESLQPEAEQSVKEKKTLPKRKTTPLLLSELYMSQLHI